MYPTTYMFHERFTVYDKIVTDPESDQTLKLL